MIDVASEASPAGVVRAAGEDHTHPSHIRRVVREGVGGRGGGEGCAACVRSRPKWTKKLERFEAPSSEDLSES